jgi:hypothetical protein
MNMTKRCAEHGTAMQRKYNADDGRLAVSPWYWACPAGHVEPTTSEERPAERDDRLG